MDRPCVLVVEDNFLLLQTLVDFLELEGFAVLTAKTGDAGLRLMRDHAPGLVLLDVFLPGEMDGSAVLHAIRDDPQLAATPVILHTATQFSPQSAEVRLADVVLQKPANISHMVQLIRRLLAGRR